MATFYIDPTVASGGDGSEGSPFHAWASVTWTAGNTYLQKRGTTHNGTITVGAAGTAASRIVIGAYGTGARPIVQGAAAEHGINLGTRAYVTVQSMHAIAGSNSARHAINGLATDATTAHYILIDDCIAESPTASGGTGIVLRGKGDIVRDSEVRNCVLDGAFVTVSDFTIRNTHIHSFDLAVGEGDGIQFAGTHDYGATKVLDCRIIGHTNSPTKQCLITAAGSGSFAVRGGEFYGMVTGLEIGVPGGTVTGAKVWGGTQRGITCAAANVGVIGCEIWDVPRGISINDVAGVRLSVNSVSASVEGVTASSGTPTYTARNNWIAAPTVHTLASGATITATNNRYAIGGNYKIHTTTYDLAGWKTACSSDANAAEVAPLFANGFQPSADSPLVGAGIYIPGAKHFGGHSMSVVSPDIGARRYFAPRTTVNRG